MQINFIFQLRYSWQPSSHFHPKLRVQVCEARGRFLASLTRGTKRTFLALFWLFSAVGFYRSNTDTVRGDPLAFQFSLCLI